MINYKENIKKYYQILSDVLLKLDVEQINDAINAIVCAYEKNKTIYVFGNGGSSSTASHIVCDFNKGICSSLEKKFRVVCLSDNVPIMTAIANDISYDNVFEFPLIGRLNEGDVLLAISVSGNSKNVIKAVEYGKEHNAVVIGMTGYDGGRLFKLADYYLHAPVNDMMKSEDIHMTFDHMIMTILTEALSDK